MRQALHEYRDEASRRVRAYRTLPAFAAATGLRPEEWQALERRDIDRAARLLTVRRTVCGGEVVELGKTPAPAARCRSPGGRSAALDALPPRLDTTLVFPAPQGGPVNLDNWRRRQWAPAVEASGTRNPPASTTCAGRSPRTRWRPGSRCSSWPASWARRWR